ncbi:flippase [Haloprofundus salinisoli]|uniref:flippase n=1 Tax=Haloprofundus salinisoli TaxID=2876193 RepID=UPI001CC95714|nr:flippase [Haloprofundus salinisoli]
MVDKGGELKTLLSSASLVIVGGLVGSAGKLFERIIVGRALAPDAYGEMNIGFAVMTFATTLSLVGFTQAIPRYLSRYDDDADRRGLWVGGMILTGALALLATVSVTVFAEQLAEWFFDSGEQAVTLLRLFGLTIPFVVGMQVAVGAIRGYENTIYKTYVQDLTYPLTRIGLIAVFLFGLGGGLLTVGYAYLVSAVLAFVVAHVLLNRLISLRGSFRTHNKKMLAFSAPLIVSTVMSILIIQMDNIMLGYFTTSFQTGQYGAAYTLASGMLVALSGFGFIMLPMASRLDADGNHEEIDTIYSTTTKWIYILTFPAFFTFVIFPGDVLQIVFNSDYLPAAQVLPILALGFFTSAMVGRNRETLSALGETKFILVSNSTAFAVNFALNVTLIPMYGFVGAGIASAVSLAVLNGIVVLVLKMKFDITPMSPANVRTFVFVPLLLLPLGFAFERYTDFSPSLVTLFPFLVTIGLLGIVVVVAVGALQEEDLFVIEFFEDRLGRQIPFVRRYFAS